MEQDRTKATGGTPACSVGHTAPTGPAGVGGSIEHDDRRAYRSSRAGGTQTARGTAADDAIILRVGPITALAFVLGALISGSAWVAAITIGSYLGLIPCEDSSADRQRLGHITKQGSSLLRFLLTEAAEAAVRWDPDWRRRFVHLAMRRDRRIAKVAMARKLAVSLYWMWRKRVRLSTDFAVRFARGRAWFRPWCEVNHRPLDWASRSLSREFEVVIMVERAIGEMGKWVGPSSARKITYANFVGR